jgi:uncharacterized protein (TIGR02466 family)
MPLQLLFSTPIFVHDFTGDQLTAIQKELDQAMPEIRKNKKLTTAGGLVETTFTFGEEHINDIEKYNLKIFETSITEKVHEYAYSMQYAGKILRLDGSWTNFFNKGYFYFDHQHLDVKLSAVYYYATTETDGNIIFQNPNPYMFNNIFPGDGITDGNMVYSPKVGRLLLWPAWLIHRVDTNLTDSERISIGVNYK